MMKKLILTGLSCSFVWLLCAQSDLLLKMEFLLDGQFRELNSKDLYYFSKFDVYSRSPFDGLELEPSIGGNLLIKRDTSDQIEIYDLFGPFKRMSESIKLISYTSNSSFDIDWIVKKLSWDTIEFHDYHYPEGIPIILIKEHDNIRHKSCFFDGAYWKRVPPPKKNSYGYESMESDTLVFSFKKYQNNGRYWGFGNYFYKPVDVGEETIRIASHSGFSYDVIHFAGSDYLLMCWEDCIIYKILKVEEDKITLLSSEQEIEIFYKTKDW